MTQRVSSAVKLQTKEQIETVVNNFAKVRHFNKVELLWEGKPNFGAADIAKYSELYNRQISKISKFSDNYMVYILSNVSENASSKMLKKYNKDIKIKNLNQRKEIVVVMDQDKVDKQNFLALLGVFPKFKDIIDEQLNIIEISEEYAEQLDKKNLYAKNRWFDITTEKKDCLVTIMVTNQMTNVLKGIVGETNLLPCSYRIISMVSMYNLLGSKNKVMGSFTKDYEVCEYDPIYNGGNYAEIKDSDIASKILNAMPGDLIICKLLMIENQPYYEFAIRKVTATTFDGENSLDSSGLCIAY
jgi:hypothetical protein